MKYLIYDLFSGVGLCNQLFSLETAIYMANISKRKLILLIKNPLCHCGKSSWDFGYLLNFLTNDFLNYLPYGFDVYYKNVPDDINVIINDNKQTKKIVYSNRFSQLVFVDRVLDTQINQQDIQDFCHNRDKCYLYFDENSNYTYLYINQSNASRCFYNFYTTSDNYKLMYDICKSLKFKNVFYDIANNIYNELNNSKNSYNIFLHLRFGDHYKNESFLTRNNDIMLKNIIPYIDGHKTNLISPKVYLLCDNKKNTEFLNKLSQYKPILIDSISNNHFDNYFKKNNMLFYDFHETRDNSINHAIIDMILSTKSDEFIGTITSTFSHYIQFLRYAQNKTYNNYANISDGKYCRFLIKTNSKYDWIKYKYNGGHPVSWHAFWDIGFNKSKTLMTIYGKTDGFGSQLQAIFSLIAYCYYKGYTYVHTPMYKMHHNDEHIQDFPNYMNSFINIENNFSTVDQLSNFDNSIVHKLKEGLFVHGSFHPEYFYNDHVLNLFREMYFSRTKPLLTYDNKYKNIAVHIRRGDVNKTKYPSRFTTNKQYIDLLKKINLDNSIIHIFSEGEENDFQDIVEAFSEIKVVMHINEEIQLTFHHLVMADVLVLAKSSFSYCAGLLNKNIKIANLITNWWHKPLRSWQIV
ncbi:MAG: hypothetical protein CMI79_02315 [Candidatus Pelagibacter sp.]|nr:hypothetical protein [Candidatus Pelagibacter sp.]|tara:strand:+ start:1939 stop:3840 length:1902 start_codon:yes stop_codon:yes gene_type:complete